MNLNQVTIPSINVKKSAAFYTTLGLRLIVDAMPRYVRFECPDGDSTLSVHKVDSLVKGAGIIIYFEVLQLDNIVNTLQQNGITFTQLPKDKSWLWREAHLLDPDDNQVILYYAGDNRKNPPWRLLHT